ncbi:hypothetical protein CKO51_09815 [Rhodopirellula sp. SM50]|nr:hypothetical protein CKO51_09815 [Rhodopirellula sp. SM50]
MRCGSHGNPRANRAIRTTPVKSTFDRSGASRRWMTNCRGPGQLDVPVEPNRIQSPSRDTQAFRYSLTPSVFESHLPVCGLLSKSGRTWDQPFRASVRACRLKKTHERP